MPVGSIRKKPNGSFEYRVMIAGKQKSFTALTKKEAVDKYTEYCRKHIIIDKNDEYTVEQWASIWLRDYKKSTVAWNTYKNYELYVQNHIIPAFGARPISTVRPIDVENFLAHKKQLSVSSQMQLYLTLKAIFEAAFENGQIEASPVRKHAFKQPEREPEHFTQDELQAIFDAADLDPDGYLVQILLYTGLRLSELRALKWQDIDQDKITIQRSVARGEHGAIEKSTKSGKIRYVPVLPELQKVLDQIDRNGEYVVHHADGTPFGDKTLWRHYNSFFDRNDLHRLSPHKCRHTYATFLLQSGVSIFDAQQLLGHSSVRVTEIYAHHIQNAVLDAGKRLKLKAN